MLTTELCCEARDAGTFLAKTALAHLGSPRPLALIAGGETVVHVVCSGKGGRCQEMALSAAIVLRGVQNAALLAAGSDGTDGPTDAAGACVDGSTAERIERAGIDPGLSLAGNNSYPALAAANALFITGATGTNVNDLSLVLLRP